MSTVKINKKETYCVVSAFADDITDFTDTIQSLLNDGWFIMGGVSACLLYTSDAADE